MTGIEVLSNGRRVASRSVEAVHRMSRDRRLLLVDEPLKFYFTQNTFRFSEGYLHVNFLIYP